MEYVYFFREKNRDFVKIGCARNSYLDRFKDFKIYSPLGAYVVGVIETDDCMKLEKKLHSKFSKKRVKGEFFELTDDECYKIIGVYDKSFGEIFDLTYRLIKEYGISKKSIHETLQKKTQSIESRKNVITKEFIEAVNELKGKVMTNTEIVDFLNLKGIEINSHNTGVFLKQLGYKNRVARLGGDPKRVYDL